MRRIAVMVFVLGCAGPTQQQLAETPSAQAPARPYEAPPASTSDKDRERAVQQMEDMETTQRARKEANQNAKKPPPAPLKKGPAEQATLPPKKKGPAEQATLPPKKGPAEEAPLPPDSEK